MEKQLKTYRAYANDLSALQMTMEAQEDQIEFTRSLVSASKIIKGSRVKGTIGAVDEYNETMTECADDANELDEALSGGRIWSDESAIDAELQQMLGDVGIDGDETRSQYSNSRPPTGPTGSAPSGAEWCRAMPQVPSGVPASPQKTDTQALALLSD